MELLDVISVSPQQDNVLILEFENGQRRRFDMTPTGKKERIIQSLQIK